MKMFRTKGLLTQINNTHLDGRIFVSINIGVGFSSSWIYADDERKFLGSATSKLFSNYIKAVVKEKYSLDIHSIVSMNSTSFFWESSEDHYLQETENIINEMVNPVINESLFKLEKQETIERFKTNYKNLEFRGRMKMLEFSSKNRDYHFDQLAMDLQNVDLENVKLLQKNLLIPDNIFLFFHGNANKEDLKNLKLPTLTNKNVRFLFEIPNLADLQDESLVVNSKGNYQCGCIKFERLPQENNLTKEYTVLDIIAEIMFNGDYTLDVDLLDASITYYKHPLKTYKNEVLNCLTEEHVEIAKANLLKRLGKSLALYPNEFTETAGRLFFNKINIFEWKETILDIDYQSIKEFLDSRDYQIREGYLMYHKEDIESGII
ncbi:hypothetical protein HHO41_14840 [Bacillus sp. DNRA2]|uniref:hypothetical protein n=1 Tax=Bacillus sp. DNRA2 TaxID=2723053 RepID=UPI00145DC73E|nr:hypothetical protein [Bacillus sp. DNRA2]NMD71577.1 hypothetical protein [Bacillus sp. DNRA2]